MGTFQGLAVPLFSDSGVQILSVATDGTVTFLTPVVLTQNVSSTTQYAGMQINITSTGALATLAAGATFVNGVMVTASSKSVANAIFMYDNRYTGGVDSVSTAVTLLGVNGTKAPANFLTISGSSPFGVGAASTNGFFTITNRLTSTASISTVTAFATIAVMSGSYVYCIPCFPNTMITAVA